MLNLRKQLRRFVLWILEFKEPRTLRAPLKADPLSRGERFSGYSGLAMQAWTWELEAIKHIVLTGIAGIAGAVTLVGTGLFKGHGEWLVYALWAFSICCFLGYIAILVGAHSIGQAAREYQNYDESSPTESVDLQSAPYIWLLIALRFGATIALLLGFVCCFYVTIQGMKKLGVDGYDPPSEEADRVFNCTPALLNGQGPSASSVVRLQCKAADR